MHKPYRRAFGMYLVINLLLVFSITLPIAAVWSHFRRSDLAGILGLWAMLSAAHFVVTLALVPSLATWLARKDAERQSRQEARRTARAARKQEKG
jgi:hypothetical protein